MKPPYPAARDVTGAIAKARAEAQAAETRVRKLSSDRFSELMRLSERERFNNLEDPQLTPEDRNKLRAALHAALPSAGSANPSKRPSPFPILRRIRLFVHRQIATPGQFITVIGVVISIAAAGCEIWKNTGDAVTIKESVSVIWLLPTGDEAPGTLNRGESLITINRAVNVAVFRKWIAGVGYAKAQVKDIEYQTN
jgi:hypothetical protein